MHFRQINGKWRTFLLGSRWWLCRVLMDGNISLYHWHCKSLQMWGVSSPIKKWEKIQYELLPRNSERCRQQTASDKTLIQQKWKICLNIFTIYSFQHKTFEILICLTRDARAGSRTLQLLLPNDRTNQEMFSIFFSVDSDFSLFSSEQGELKTVTTSNFHWLV